MLHGKVIGSVVSTVKHECLEGRKLLLVQIMDAHGNPEGVPIILIDFAGAGKGDRVITSHDGISTHEFLDMPTAPQRSNILAIIDDGPTPDNFKGNYEGKLKSQKGRS